MNVKLNKKILIFKFVSQVESEFDLDFDDAFHSKQSQFSKFKTLATLVA